MATMPLGALGDTLSGALIAAASSYGERLAVADVTRSASYAELLGQAEDVSAGLGLMGVGRGDRVGLLAGNSIEWVEVCFGTLLTGATLVPLSTWSTASELEFLITDSGIRTLFALTEFAGRDFRPDLSQFAAKGLEVIVLAGADLSPLRTYQSFKASSQGHRKVSNSAQPSDDALVLYTSGSTSVPKGVRLTHSAMVANGFNIGERQGLTRDDRVLLSAPLFWAYGAANALPATITHGATLVLQEKFDAEGTLDLIETHRCTAIYTLPAMTSALVRSKGFARARVASLRTGLTIGSSEEFLFAVNDLGVAELCNIYGSTETCGNCAVTWHHWPLERRAKTQGTPLPGQNIRIRDLETGELIAPHLPGLMEVKGYITPGYSGKSAELNEEIFTPDGFYRTGDIGYIDGDGALVFIGRHSEMIKRAGINVSPAEIEAEMFSFDGVAAVCVVGIPDPDRGEAIVAFVVPVDAAAFEIEELSDHLRATLSKYKWPDRLEIRRSLPLTSTGKLHRKKIKEDALELFA